jgi:thiamine-phosphate pyrophosphorylase
MTPLSECHLYALVDTKYLRNRSAQTVAARLCAGGADLIQLRAKNSPAAEIRRMAAAILPVTTQAGVWFVINDHPQIAAEVGAPLCHMGQDDFFGAGHSNVAQLTTRPAGPKIGLSSHEPAQAERAIAAGAAYIAVGPVYPTDTKPSARPVTLSYVRWAAANVRIPWFAIGGIDLQNLDDVLAAGARRVCVVSAILNSPDIVEACQNFKKRLRSAPPRDPAS